MGDANPAVPASSRLTVALDIPSAQVLADQAVIIQDLQFVMESCKRLLAELARPEEERDPVVPVALWSAALVAYARCFATGQRFGLTTDDVTSVPLQGEVLSYHKWVVRERNAVTRHPVNPFHAAVVGAALSAPEALSGPGGRSARTVGSGSPDGPARPTAPSGQVEGIVILSTSHVLVDDTGVRQLGGLASELARQTAEKMKAQQDLVLADARNLGPDRLRALPPVPLHDPGAEDAEAEGRGTDDALDS
jgi:hypothetical protein